MSDSLETPPKKPVSEKQLAGNRANAARFTVVCVEDAAELEQLRAGLIATYQPVNSQELFTIGRIALAQWSILRTSQLEASTLTVAMNDSLSNPQTYLEDELTKNLEITRPQNNGFFMAEGFRLLARQSNSLSLMLRYQAQAERLYRRSIEEFERLRKLRPELPNDQGQTNLSQGAAVCAAWTDPSVPGFGAEPAPNEPNPGGAGDSACRLVVSNPQSPSQPLPRDPRPLTPVAPAPNATHSGL